MTEQMDWDLGEGETITVPAFEALCKATYEQSKLVDDCEAKRKEENARLDKLKAKVLAYLEQFGKEKHFVAGYGTIGIRNRFTVTMPKDPERREEFFAFLRGKGVFDDLVTVHSQTLNSFYDAEMSAAKETGNVDFQVPGLDEPKHMKQIQLRKG